MKSKEIGISWSYRSSTLLPIVRRPYSPMELNVSEETILVNNKLTASCPTNMSPKYYIKCYKQQKWILKNF